MCPGRNIELQRRGICPFLDCAPILVQSISCCVKWLGRNRVLTLITFKHMTAPLQDKHQHIAVRKNGKSEGKILWLPFRNDDHLGCSSLPITPLQSNWKLNNIYFYFRTYLFVAREAESTSMMKTYVKFHG